MAATPTSPHEFATPAAGSGKVAVDPVARAGDPWAALVEALAEAIADDLERKLADGSEAAREGGGERE